MQHFKTYIRNNLVIVHILNQIYRKHKEGECLLKKRESNVSPNCAGNFILLYKASSNNFVSLALHTSQINSAIKPYTCICVSKTQTSEKLQLIGSTGGTDCTFNCVYYVSLPLTTETELAKVKGKELPPFLAMVSVPTKERLSSSTAKLFFFVFLPDIKHSHN